MTIRRAHFASSSVNTCPTAVQAFDWKALASLALLVGLALPAWAQYKVVGPDGKVTYTDRPPVGAVAQPLQNQRAGQATLADNLPYELKQVASRFPVTLYSSPDCAPCDAGRNMLKQRGIPYTERTVSNSTDSAEFKRLEGSDSLPLLRIGAQQLHGFTASEWTSYLDMAGYPAQSKLPLNYVAPTARALAPASQASATASTAAKPTPAPVAPTAPLTPPPTTANRFRF